MCTLRWVNVGCCSQTIPLLNLYWLVALPLPCEPATCLLESCKSISNYTLLYYTLPYNENVLPLCSEAYQLSLRIYHSNIEEYHKHTEMSWSGLRAIALVNCCPLVKQLFK